MKIDEDSKRLNEIDGKWNNGIMEYWRVGILIFLSLHPLFIPLGGQGRKGTKKAKWVKFEY